MSAIILITNGLVLAFLAWIAALHVSVIRGSEHRNRSLNAQVFRISNDQYDDLIRSGERHGVDRGTIDRALGYLERKYTPIDPARDIALAARWIRKEPCWEDRDDYLRSIFGAHGPAIEPILRDISNNHLASFRDLA